MAQVTGTILKILYYTMFPIVALLLGALISSKWPPSRVTQSLVQHFAAGVIFAALAGEVLPDLTRSHPHVADILIGFAIGTLVLLGIRWLVEKRLEPPEGKGNSPLNLLLVIGIDLIMDGLLVGIGVVAGEVNGFLITAALTIEILFLGLSTAATFTAAGAKGNRVFLMTLSLALPILLGALIGGLLLGNLPQNYMVIVLSFAASALLYLVTEELLVEAHEVPETPFSAAIFFGGFLALYLLELLG